MQAGERYDGILVATITAWFSPDHIVKADAVQGDLDGIACMFEFQVQALPVPCKSASKVTSVSSAVVIFGRSPGAS